MIKAINFLIEKSTDPIHNLAMEAYLTETVEPGSCTLYLWQNRNTVVIGKNQNAWTECRTASLERDGGKMVRRLSGGGAVYHDMGNLNFTFSMNKEDYDLRKQQNVIIEACRLIGINAISSGRNDLLAEGSKFSGNSFYFHNGKVFHNGTLLVDVDMKNLGKYLSPSKAKIESKGVKSVTSRVINLKEMCPELTVSKMISMMIRAFEKIYGMKAVALCEKDFDENRIAVLKKYFSDEEWRFGKRIPFNFSSSNRFEWGEVTAELQIERGICVAARIYTDALNDAFAEKLEKCLTGRKFTLNEIKRAVEECKECEAYQENIIELLTDMEPKMKYDVAIIGGGPGGYTAACAAACEGLSVVMFEKDKLGGTCLNRGCMPTKALLHTAELWSEMNQSEKFGIKTEGLRYDFAAMNKRKNDVVSRLRADIEQLMKKHRISVVYGEATIKAPEEIICEGTLYEASNIIIATGSVPAVPPIKGIDGKGIFSSTDLLENEGKEFSSIVIIGGGVIGTEFASIYNELGCNVTIIEAMDRILPPLDKEISQRLSMIFNKSGIAIHTKATVKELESTNEGVNVIFTDKNGKEVSIRSDGVLISTGRRANTNKLLGENISISLTKGAVIGDDFGCTNIKGIYVIGDAKAGNVQLAHVAEAQAKNVIAYISGSDKQIDMKHIPSCVYTSPEIATVGFTESEAKAAGFEVKTGKYITGANGKCVIEGAESGYIKIIADAKTGKLIGAQMVCPRATDMIGEMAIAIANELTIDNLASVIHPHPTFIEMIKGAAEAL